MADDTMRCSQCGGNGYILYVDEKGYEIYRECSCMKVRRAKELLARSGITKEFQKKSFDNFETSDNEVLADAKNTSEAYVETFAERENQHGNSILFSGQVGAGKTHLGTAVSAALLKKGIEVIYMPYRNEMTGMKQKMMDEQEYSRKIRLYSKARILFIDDFLKGRITETDVNITYEIINYRYLNNLPVIISTEKSLEELLAFDEAVGSRIIEMCRGNIIRFRGKRLNYRIYGRKAGVR